MKSILEILPFYEGEYKPGDLVYWQPWGELQPTVGVITKAVKSSSKFNKRWAVSTWAEDITALAWSLRPMNQEYTNYLFAAIHEGDRLGGYEEIKPGFFEEIDRKRNSNDPEPMAAEHELQLTISDVDVKVRFNYTAAAAAEKDEYGRPTECEMHEAIEIVECRPVEDGMFFLELDGTIIEAIWEIGWEPPSREEFED